MDKCQSCESERLVYVGGDFKDCGYITFGAYEHDGYLPQINNIGSSEINIVVCLECGQTQGKWPVADPQITLDCYECEEEITLDFGCIVCPECGEYPHRQHLREADPEPKEHGGVCEVKVPTRKCRLLIDIDVPGFSRNVGHEMVVWHEDNIFAVVEILGQRCGLTIGTEVEMVDG